MKTYFLSAFWQFLFLASISVGIIFSVGAQKSEVIEIKWMEPASIYESGKEVFVPAIEGQFLSGNKPSYFYKKKVEHDNYQLLVTLVSTAPALRKEVNYLSSQSIEVGTEFIFNAGIRSDGRDSYAVVDLFPFIRQGDQIQRILSFRVEMKKSISGQKQTAKEFATSSVLQQGSGIWYKISVDKDGIYKIDKDFLESLGIDVANLNPQHINIYGNGDGLLPELNSAPRTDDLAKNAILVMGENDGVFDDGDYILFYGWGPHRWQVNGSGRFEQERHIYSDISCYFININTAEPPLRIGSENSTVSPPTGSVSDYNYFAVHENDLISLVHGGQRWYGELFDTQLERTFSFTVPDVISSSPASFEVSLASDAKTSAGTAQSYSINGIPVFTSTLPTAIEFGRSTNSMALNNPGSSLPLKISITRNSPSVMTYLDKITLNARRKLKFNNGQFNFRDLTSVGPGTITAFTVQDFPTGGSVWDITNRHEPKIINGTLTGNDFEFVLGTDSLREFVVTDLANFLTPKKIGSVTPQNIHALPQAHYLIVTHKNFTTQAERLADLHRATGLIVHVVTTEQIYNEFSSGMQDATAIRSFCKMFWDRGEAAPDTRPRSLLLFGDGTYDPKNRVANNNNFVLTYQMENSENHIDAMPSDDYFGILDDSESMNSIDLVDIGVGRLLISDNQMAKEQVDKIQHYMHNGSSLYSTSNTNCGTDNGASTYGDWRTKYVQIADDEENNYFLNFDVEPQYNYVRDSFPEMNCEKIYLDAYQQVITAGGARYPDVNEAIDRAIDRGALLINYVGHGGEVGVAEERVITVPMIQEWKNINKMPLMVTATCEFTKFDDPDRVSAGEWASINPLGAAIALMTTTRSVYFSTNTQIGTAFFKEVFERNSDFSPRNFGEIIAETKNAVAGDNKRSFLLIGDPALRLALPELTVVTDSINGLSATVEMDTLRALSKVTVKGHVEDYIGNPLTSYNGVLYPTVYDKPKTQVTLSNDGPVLSPEKEFLVQNSKVYAGKSSVKNGYFEFTFIVPKDIDYAIDFGKISYYAENSAQDAIGFDTLFYIGGIDPNGLNDSQGPDVELFLNDEHFVSGGITDETPILIAKLFDENGINTAGSGIGHDLVAILDNETSKPIVLNDFYTADLDSYQSGEIRYNFASLEPGEHTLTIKVWDVNNNSSETAIRFVVKQKEEMALDHVLNYPNPFTTRTEFYFEHNQVCNSMEAQVQIFTVSGRLVKTINQWVHTEGYRSEGIEWDGRDDFGDQLAKGVYVYRVSAKTTEGAKAEKYEKLVILK